MTSPKSNQTENNPTENRKTVRIFTPHDPFPPREGADHVVANQASALKELGFEVEVVHWLRKGLKSQYDRDHGEPLPKKFVRAARFLLSEEASPELVYYPIASMSRELRRKPVGFEIFHYSFAHAWLRRLPRTGARRVVHFHNLESDLFKLRAETAANPLAKALHRLNVRRLSAHENALASMTDERWFVSQSDLDHARATNSGGALRLVAPGFDRAVGEKRRQAFLKSGNTGTSPLVAGILGRYDFEPNRASLAWVVEELAPVLQEKKFKGKIQVLGKNVPHDLKERAKHYSFIEILGFVPDAEDLWKSWSWVLVPQLGGSGVRIKLLEALASGVPVLANEDSATPLEPALKKLLTLRELQNPEEWARVLLDQSAGELRARLSEQEFPKELDPRKIYEFMLGTLL